MNAQENAEQRIAFGQEKITWINGRGFYTLYLKEVQRFLKIHLQTIWAPALMTLMFMVIFLIALGRGGVQIAGVPYATFLVPGLIAMAMMQNAFANSSSSLVISKIQGNIIDILMTPLSAIEILLAMAGSAVTRSLCIGFALMLIMYAWPSARIIPHHPLVALYFAVMGSLMLGIIGMIAGIWAARFDHIASVTNFFIQPLSLLSGTFYSISALPSFWVKLSNFNPFFYVIDGVRYGFIGNSEGNILLEALALAIINMGLIATGYRLLQKGWKLKA